MKKTFIIVGSLIIVAGLVGGGIWYWQKNKAANNQPVVVNQQTTSTQQEVSQNSTSTWLTYKDDKYGFEFQYPPSINGRNVEIKKFQEGDSFSFVLFEPKNPGPTAPNGTSPYFYHYFDLSFKSLKDSNFQLTSYVFYNHSENQWYQLTNGSDGNAYNKKISWDDAGGFIKGNDKAISIIDVNWPLLKTIDGTTAYPTAAGAGDESVINYSMINKGKLMYLNLSVVTFESDDINLPPEFKAEGDLLGDIMKKIIFTIKF